jgi:hypothetical protein
MRKTEAGQGNAATEAAVLATRPHESYKWLILKNPHLHKTKVGTQLRHLRDPTKLLFGWGRWVGENFVGADDLAMEGAGN